MASGDAMLQAILNKRLTGDNFNKDIAKKVYQENSIKKPYGDLTEDEKNYYELAKKDALKVISDFKESVEDVQNEITKHCMVKCNPKAELSAKSRHEKCEFAACAADQVLVKLNRFNEDVVSNRFRGISEMRDARDMTIEDLLTIIDTLRKDFDREFQTIKSLVPTSVLWTVRTKAISSFLRKNIIIVLVIALILIMLMVVIFIPTLFRKPKKNLHI